MKLILYSDINSASIRDNLGNPEYSYYFVLEAFRPVLEQIGAVELVQRPAEEVDAIFDSCAARGEDCVFISFSPPNAATLGLRCPTVLVVAWEFSTLPDGGWPNADPRDDWRYVFGRLGFAISLSTHTARVIRQAMGEDFPVFPIAAPVWDRMAGTIAPRGAVMPECEMWIAGSVIDSADYVLSPDSLAGGIFPPVAIRPPILEAVPEEPEPDVELEPEIPEPAPEEPIPEIEAEPEIPEPAPQEPIPEIEPELEIPEPAPAEPIPEMEPEPEVPEPGPEPAAPAQLEMVEVPRRRPGLRYRLAVTKRHAVEWYREAVRDLLPRPLAWVISRAGILAEALYRRLIGWKPPAPPPPPPLLEEQPPPIDPVVPEGIVLEPEPAHEPYPESADVPESVQVIEPQEVFEPAEMAIPLPVEETEVDEPTEEAWLEPADGPFAQEAFAEDTTMAEAIEAVIEPAPEIAPPPPRRPLPRTLVRLDGVVYVSLLNPTDGRKNWHDIVTAFCWAFRDVANATLVLKMIKSDAESYRRDLFLTLVRLAPFKCRVVAVAGFLEDSDYIRLIETTSFYVNASNAEGLCLPLMEFMSAGKPVIAPRHTAMSDYIDESAAFIVDSTLEHNVWPNDPRHLYTTMRHRPKWDTLAAAFERSYKVASESPRAYAEMGQNAAEIMRRYCSDAVVREQLRTALERVADSGRAAGAREEAEAA
jgi:glycosyltransferase involved in cell wall biosynthesis